MEFNKPDRMTISRSLLEVVNEDAMRLYRQHEQGIDNCCPKTDSWRDMSDFRLVEKLDEEFGEFKMALLGFNNLEEQYKELLDVINVLKMVGAKIILEREKKNGKRK
jgi:hypothetical protein